jgi:hypothetical protein
VARDTRQPQQVTLVPEQTGRVGHATNRSRGSRNSWSRWSSKHGTLFTEQEARFDTEQQSRRSQNPFTSAPLSSYPSQPTRPLNAWETAPEWFLSQNSVWVLGFPRDQHPGSVQRGLACDAPGHTSVCQGDVSQQRIAHRHHDKRRTPHTLTILVTKRRLSELQKQRQCTHTLQGSTRNNQKHAEDRTSLSLA